MRTTLSELQQDTLKETFNLAIGRAAAALSAMVGEEIHLTVPQLVLLNRWEANALITTCSENHLTAVKQSFSGPFSGMALLIYPEENSLELVHILLRESVPLASLTEMEQESLTEVGNIILNACLGTFANVMGAEFQCDIPEYLAGPCDQLLDRMTRENGVDGEDEPMILLYVDFVIHETAIKGYVLLLLDRLAVASLKRELDSLCAHLPG